MERPIVLKKKNPPKYIYIYISQGTGDKRQAQATGE